MVITGLTRNQFEGNLTWVRIPPSPPIMKRWGFPSFYYLMGMVVGFELKNSSQSKIEEFLYGTFIFHMTKTVKYKYAIVINMV